MLDLVASYKVISLGNSVAFEVHLIIQILAMKIILKHEIKNPQKCSWKVRPSFPASLRKFGHLIIERSC